jgi:hypothetical protein
LKPSCWRSRADGDLRSHLSVLHLGVGDSGLGDHGLLLLFLLDGLLVLDLSTGVGLVIGGDSSSALVLSSSLARSLGLGGRTRGFSIVATDGSSVSVSVGISLLLSGGLARSLLLLGRARLVLSVRLALVTVEVVVGAGLLLDTLLGSGLGLGLGGSGGGRGCGECVSSSWSSCETLSLGVREY